MQTVEPIEVDKPVRLHDGGNVSHPPFDDFPDVSCQYSVLLHSTNNCYILSFFTSFYNCEKLVDSGDAVSIFSIYTDTVN